MKIILENYLFEMLKFKKIIREGKIQRLVETWKPLALGESTFIFLIILWNIYVIAPFWQF